MCRLHRLPHHAVSKVTRPLADDTLYVQITLGADIADMYSPGAGSATRTTDCLTRGLPFGSGRHQTSYCIPVAHLDRSRAFRKFCSCTSSPAPCMRPATRLPMCHQLTCLRLHLQPLTWQLTRLLTGQQPTTAINTTLPKVTSLSLISQDYASNLGWMSVGVGSTA